VRIDVRQEKIFRLVGEQGDLSIKRRIGLDKRMRIGAARAAGVGLLGVKQIVVPQLRPGGERGVQLLLLPGHGFHEPGEMLARRLLKKRPHALQPDVVQGLAPEIGIIGVGEVAQRFELRGILVLL